MDQTQTRAEQVAEGRRRRTTIGVSGDPSLRRFGVDDSILDDKYAYRSVADDGTRLYQLTENDDYEFVTNKGDKASKGDAAGVLKYQHGVVDGQAKYTYLLRKLKSYDQADRQERLSAVDAEEKARMKSSEPDSALKGEKTYKPK